ncbi:histidine kinase [Streptosporangium sp. NBC_01639]|uniref:sensor histidine kinase n=1 Tax=Streptosporangium sp. NBC_01639 TaxID=2975948 RepID=UPI003870A532|nr:histidine kinase [Streptosporangium sp. NBC_01639]
MRWVRRSSRREALRDLLLWALLCLPAVLAPVVPPWWEPSDGWAAWAAVAGAVGLGGAVLVSRRAPLVGMLIVLAAGSWNVGEGLATVRLWRLDGLVTLGPLNGFTPAIVVLSWLTGRRAARSRPAALAFTAILGTATALTLVTSCGPRPDPATSRFWFPLLSGILLSALLPWGVGRLRWQRVEQRAREQSLIVGQAQLHERNRIAQDMHDSLGHDLALIALRAAALEMAPDLAEQHRRAAGELREAAADTTERLRTVIGVLREGERAPLTPPRESVAELVERARESGVRVELTGEESLRDRTACRVVQEALTNATKHAPGSPVTVQVLRTSDEITVTVTNRAAPAPPGRPRGGLGLIGLHERVRLAGGTFTSGWTGAGFRVVARFPPEAFPRETEDLSQKNGAT